MFKSILVPLTGLPSDDAALETAYLTARMFDSHLDCLHVRPGWPELLASAGARFSAEVGLSDELANALESAAKSSAWRANRHFAEFCRRWRVPLHDAPPGPAGVSASWREETGSTLEKTIASARVHDLVVLGRSPESDPLSASGIGEVMIAGGRPLLLAPVKAPENLAPTVAIAWKDTAEAARAATAAMPILAKAERIVVLSAAENDDTAEALLSAEAVARQLRWHGLKTEAYGIAAAERAASDAVLDMARASGADMLVMGGFGHSRLREFVFGGFTRQVLRECRLPVFLFH